MAIARVCVFCGSSPGADPDFGALAERLGTLLAERGVSLDEVGAELSRRAKPTD